MHPQLVKNTTKEIQWFARLRWQQYDNAGMSKHAYDLIRGGADVRNVTFYISMFDKATREVEKHVHTDNGRAYHSRVIAETSPSNLHLVTNWELLPGNEGLQEPRFTHLDYIKHLVPKTKIIIILREPVSRLYSDYYSTTNFVHGSLPTSPEDFHRTAVTLVRTYTTCFKSHSIRQCVYSNSLRNGLIKKGIWLAESFAAGFYCVYLADIYKVFPRDQVLTLLTSEYAKNMNTTLSNVFRFLKLDPMTSTRMEKTVNQTIANPAKTKQLPMLKETQLLLNNFYKPLNKFSVQLMNDSRFYFDDL